MCQKRVINSIIRITLLAESSWNCKEKLQFILMAIILTFNRLTEKNNSSQIWNFTNPSDVKRANKKLTFNLGFSLLAKINLLPVNLPVPFLLFRTLRPYITARIRLLYSPFCFIPHFSSRYTRVLLLFRRNSISVLWQILVHFREHYKTNNAVSMFYSYHVK